MISKLTPVLYVDAIEPVLPFWVSLLGFNKAVEVPHDDKVGFVILERDGIEVMYQTWASVAADMPGFETPSRGASVTLYVEVDDLKEVEAALRSVRPSVPRRRTPYGADETGWKEPGGHTILFAQRAK